MFYTSQEALISTPVQMSDNGSKLWRWVEFGLYIPYFLVTQLISEESSEIGQHLIFGQIQDLMAHAAQLPNNVVISEIGLLSPGYMNGTDNFQLGVIKEIWKSKQQSNNFLFIMKNGQTLSFPPDIAPPDRRLFELLFAI